MSRGRRPVEEKLHSFSKAYEDEEGGKKKREEIDNYEERLHAVEKSGASIYKYLIQVCKKKKLKKPSCLYTTYYCSLCF